MVRLGARSGYEIKQTVELSLRFFWTVSPAQIYPSLEQLERAGLIKGTSERPSGRRRRVFAITRSGETTLRAWLRQDEPMRFELRDIGLVKLFFADALDRDDALALLRMVKRRSEGRVATLRSIEPAALTSEQAGNIYPMLTLRMGIAFHQAALDVCTKFEQKFFANSAPSGPPSTLRGEVASGCNGSHVNIKTILRRSQFLALGCRKGVTFHV